MTEISNAQDRLGHRFHQWAQMLRAPRPICAILCNLWPTGLGLVVASNAWDDAICDLYRDDFALFQVGVQHGIGATGERRVKRAEMLAIDEAHAGVFDAAGSSLKIKRIR